MGCRSPRLFAASTLIVTGNGSPDAEATLGVRRTRRARARPTPRGRTSEVELQAELELTGSAEGAGDPPGRGGVDRGGGRVEAWRVREVEALHAELEVVAEALEDREVEVAERALAQDLASRVPVRELGGQDERCRVEPLLGRRVVELSRADAVGPLVPHAGVRPVRADRRSERPPAAQDEDRLHLPPAEERLRHAVRIPEEALAAAEGQLPARAQREVVGGVEGRDCILWAGVAAVLGK